MADNTEDGFKVVDRRPFTAEGELRKEVVEEQEREAKREEAKEKAEAKSAPAEEKAAAPAAGTAKRSPAFENLIRMIGSNAAMVLGAYADPNTGQPMFDPDAARELIDMLDALREKPSRRALPAPTSRHDI